MMEGARIITLVFLLVAIISCTEKTEVERTATDTILEIVPPKVTMTLEDRDSIGEQVFFALSRYDGKQLMWKIAIRENGQLVKEISDSTNSLSYLVKAVDLNADGVGELMFVTARFELAYEQTETLRCQIYCYLKQDGNWQKKEVPALTDAQKKGYVGHEVVSVENNRIKRQFPIYTQHHTDTGKKRILLYRLSPKGEWMVKEK